MPTQTLTFAISGGADAAKFAIDSNTGVLRFVSAPNYEAPTDVGGNNVYDVQVTSSDGVGLTDVQDVAVSVTNVNEAPTISTISDQVINEDIATGALTFTVGDLESPANALSVSATSSNTTIIPNGNLLLGGGGSNRTINVIPGTNQNGGPVTITLSVSDGSLTTQTTFTVTVNAVNDLPVVSTNQLTITEGATVVLGSGYLNATDPDNTAAQLTYNVSSVSGGQFEFVSAAGTAITTFTQQQINSGAVQFVHDGGEAAPTYTLAASDGSLTSAPSTVTISSFTSINDAPVATAPVSVTMTAGLGYTFTGATALSVADSDAGSSPIRVSLTLAEGTLTLASTTGLTFTSGDGTADTAMVFTGLVADINAALDGLIYNSAINHAPTESLSFVVNDLGNTGLGGSLQDSKTTTINITTPSNPILGDGFLQGSVLEIGFGTDGVIGSDMAAPAGFNSAGSQLAAESDRNRDGWGTYDGDFILPGTPEEAWGVNVGGTTYSNSNISAMQVSGSLTNFVDSGTAQAIGWAGSVAGLDVATTYLVTDGDLFLDVTVTLTNSSGSTLNNVYYYRNVDPDNNVLQGASDGFTTVNTVLSQGNDGSHVAFVTATQSDGSYLGLMGFGSNARVAYGGFANRNPIAIYDGTGGMNPSGTQTADIGVALAFKIDTLTVGSSETLRFRYYFGNAAEPLLDLDANNSSGATGANFATTFTEAGGPVAIVDSDATVFDADSANLTGMTITITNLLDSGLESLSATTVGSITASFTGNTLTLSGTDSVANYRQVLQSITYNNTSLNPDVTPRVITFTATDGANFSQTARTTVAMIAANNSPTITSPAAVSIAENTTVVMTVTSADPDGPAPLYSITGGADSSLFTINPTTGALSFIVAPDRENPTDANLDDVYVVTVQVSDGSLTDSRTIAVTITDVDEFNVGAITDVDGTLDAVDENSAIGTNVGITASASDADATTNAITYTLDVSAGGRFAINGSTGVITVAGGIDYETATTYAITVRATSADLSFSTQTFVIAINPLNDNAPVVTSNGGGTTAGTSIAENTTAVTTVTAIDADLPAQTLTYSISGGADAALFTIDVSTGVLSFVTAPDFEIPTDADLNNVYEVQVTVSDGAGLSDSQDISVTVTDTNEVPTISAIGDQLIGEDGTTGPLSFIVGDQETAPGSLVVTAVSSNTTLIPNGNLILGGAGVNRTVTVNPAANQFGGPVTITLTVSDGVNSSQTTFTVTMLEVNDAPVANADSATTNEDNAVSGNVLTNDTDIDNTDGIPGNEDTATAVLDSGPTNGSLLFNADGSFTYTPNANYFGTDTFTYHAVDSDGAPSNIATVTITVNEVNDAPVAVDDVATTNEDTSVTGDVLANDTDNDNTDGVLGNEETHTAVLNAGPINGSLNLNSNGSFTYTPNPDFFGTDSFTYHAVDSRGLAGNIATVTITVTEVNDAPIANADSATTNEDNAVSGNVLTNDTDIDNTDGIPGNEDTATAVLDSGPTNGSLLFNNDGSFTYAPDPDYFGFDSFTYHAVDSRGLPSNIATVTLTVNSINDAPINGVPGPQTITEETPLVFSATNGNPISISDVDVFSGNVAVRLIGTNGTLTLSITTNLVFATGDGTADYDMAFAGTLADVNAALNGLLFSPDLNYNGSASLQIITGDLGNSGAGGQLIDDDTIAITINPINDAPTATDDAYSTNEDTPLTITASGVLTNDNDIDGNPLQSVLVSGPIHGTLTLNSDGKFLYTPDFDYNGLDVFTYRAFDGALSSNLATVTLTINAVNDAPRSQNDAYSVNQFATLTVIPSGVLGNDLDVEGDTMTVSLIAGPTNGTLTLNADGSFSYIVTGVFAGTDSFTYQATDGSASGNIVTVIITVNQTANSGGGTGTGGGTGGTGGGTGSGGTGITPPGPTTTTPPVTTINPGSTHVTGTSGTSTGSIPTTSPVILVTLANVSSERLHELGWSQSAAYSSKTRVSQAPALPSTQAEAVTNEFTALSFVLHDGLLWNQLDEFRESLNQSTDSDKFARNLVVGTTASIGSSLTVGYVLWLLRGGSLIASFVSTLPAWTLIDPLPILDTSGLPVSTKDEEDDSLNALIGRAQANRNR